MFLSRLSCFVKLCLACCPDPLNVSLPPCFFPRGHFLVLLLHVTASRLCKTMWSPCRSHHRPSWFVQLASPAASCSLCSALSDPSRSIFTSIYHHPFTSCCRHHGSPQPQLLSTFETFESVPSLIFNTVPKVERSHEKLGNN